MYEGVSKSFWTGFAMGRSPVQVFLPKFLYKFALSEVNSEPEQAEGPNEQQT
jgi:hypothetical protein